MADTTTAELKDVKIKITFADDGSYTFNRVKLGAGDQQIFDTAVALGMLRSGTLEKVYKLVESTITK